MTTNGTALATRDQASIIESVIAAGDLAKLTPAQRTSYYREVCGSIGLNELTQPFQYLALNGKLVLYAGKGCTDQLREIKGVSITRIDKDQINDLFVVTAYASRGDRQDSEIGAVSVAGLRGESLANAMMKAITKAKRRVTLSICGLGMLDETEVETIPNAETVVVDSKTGEVLETRPARPSANVADDQQWQRWTLLSHHAEAYGVTAPTLNRPIAVTLLQSEYQKLQAQIKQAKQSADDPPPTESAPSSRVSEVPPTASDTRDSELTGALVIKKDHPLWQRWLAAEAGARAAGLEIDTSGVKLGKITEVSLDASCADLESMIAEKNSTEPEAF